MSRPPSGVDNGGSSNPRTQVCCEWNNRAMDQLRALRVFVRVSAEGSFAAAARALDLALTEIGQAHPARTP